jgi:hypothetical protein
MLMKPNGVIAAAAALALGTIALATDASAQSVREHGGRSGSALNASSNVGTSGSRVSTNLRESRNFSEPRRSRTATTGFASTQSGKSWGTKGYTRTSNWDRGDWRRHHRFSRSSASFGIGFADYGYGYDWGPDYVGYGYDWAPGYGYAGVGYGAGYGGCSCGNPGYAFGYGYDYPAYAYAGPAFGIGVGFGFSGRPFHHRHW